MGVGVGWGWGWGWGWGCGGVGRGMGWGGVIWLNLGVGVECWCVGVGCVGGACGWMPALHRAITRLRSLCSTGYIGLYNFFDPDDYINLGALLFSGDAYVRAHPATKVDTPSPPAHAQHCRSWLPCLPCCDHVSLVLHFCCRLPWLNLPGTCSVRPAA